MRVITRPFEPFATCEARISKARSGFSSETRDAGPGSRTGPWGRGASPAGGGGAAPGGGAVWGGGPPRRGAGCSSRLRRRITGSARSTAPRTTAMARRSIGSTLNGGLTIGPSGTAVKRSTWLALMFTVRGFWATEKPSAPTVTTFAYGRVPTGLTTRSVSRIHRAHPAASVLRGGSAVPPGVPCTQAPRHRGDARLDEDVEEVPHRGHGVHGLQARERGVDGRHGGGEHLQVPADRRHRRVDQRRGHVQEEDGAEPGSGEGRRVHDDIAGIDRAQTVVPPCDRDPREAGGRATRGGAAPRPSPAP